MVDLARARDGALVRRELAAPSLAKLRFARWFIDARWPVSTVADLFDLDPADLAAALDHTAAAA